MVYKKKGKKVKIKVSFELKLPDDASFADLEDYFRTVLEMRPQAVSRENSLYNYDLPDLGISDLQITIK
jgi:hypothetical protein